MMVQRCETASVHSIVVLVLDGVVPFDVAVPCEVFGRVRRSDGTAGYQITVCGPTPKPRRIDAGVFGIIPTQGLGALEGADTIVLPGVEPFLGVPAAVLRALRRAAERGARMISVCAGTFVLAATGLLDGMRVTTHWAAASDFAALYPDVLVDPDVLFVDNGQVLTSAGAAAALDLCLHIVRRDYGALVASSTARMSVMPLERGGGQAQYIARHMLDTPTPSLAPLLLWAEENLRGLTVPLLARRAGMSERTLHRRFRTECGCSPSQWLQRARVLRAQYLLEVSDRTVDAIALDVGYQSTGTLRAQFRAHLRTHPAAYRRELGGLPSARSPRGDPAPRPS